MVNGDEDSGATESGEDGGPVYGGEERKESWENNKTLVDQAHGRSSEANPQRWVISNGGWKDHEV